MSIFEDTEEGFKFVVEEVSADLRQSIKEEMKKVHAVVTSSTHSPASKNFAKDLMDFDNLLGLQAAADGHFIITRFEYLSDMISGGRILSPGEVPLKHFSVTRTKQEYGRGEPTHVQMPDVVLVLGRKTSCRIEEIEQSFLIVMTKFTALEQYVNEKNKEEMERVLADSKELEEANVLLQKEIKALKQKVEKYSEALNEKNFQVLDELLQDATTPSAKDEP